MERFYEMVFRRAGQWTKGGKEPVLQLNVLQDRENVLHAFVTSGSFEYVGKTIQTCYGPISGYQKLGIGQRTNWRNRIAIIDLLRQGQRVQILELAGTCLLRYDAFHLNLAPGLRTSRYTVVCESPAVSPLWRLLPM